MTSTTNYIKSKTGKTELEYGHYKTYEMIVNDIGLDKFARAMPASIETIKKALETDKHLNNIPLRHWDARQYQAVWLFNTIGITGTSLSQAVSLLKQAARMLAERE